MKIAKVNSSNSIYLTKQYRHTKADLMRGLNKSRALLGIYTDVSLILILLIWQSYCERGLNSITIFICFSIFVIYLFNMVNSRVIVWKNINVTLTTELGFGIFYFLVFYNVYLKDLMGLSEYSYNTMISNTYPDFGNSAIILSTIGFVSFHAGTKLAIKRNFSRVSKMAPLKYNYHLFDISISISQFLMMSLFIVFGMKSDDTGRYSAGSRVEAVQAQMSADSGGNSLANFLYLIVLLFSIISISRIIFLLASKTRLSFFHYFMMLNVLIWSVHILLGGDRNNFFIIALAVGGGYCAFVRRVSWGAIGLGALGAFALYQVIEVSRMMDEVSISEVMSVLSNEPSKEERSSSFDGSALVLRASLSASPDHIPFANGYYKLVGFSGVIPMSRQLIITENSGFRTSAEALTYFIIGPSAGWSVGTNIISDIYMDWGKGGVVLMMVLVGWFAVRVRNTLSQELSLRGVFLYVCTLSTISELPRYSFDAPVRLLVWGMMVILIYEFACGPLPPQSQSRLSHNLASR